MSILRNAHVALSNLGVEGHYLAGPPHLCGGSMDAGGGWWLGWWWWGGGVTHLEEEVVTLYTPEVPECQVDTTESPITLT